MQSTSGVNKGCPSLVPRRPRSHHRAGREALGFGPRQLFCPQFRLCRPVGEVQPHSHSLGLEGFVEADHALNLVVNLAGMRAHWDGTVFVKAGCGFHENNRFNRRLIAQFQRMFGKGSDGAPHGHASCRPPPFIKPAMPKNDSPEVGVVQHGFRLEHP